MGGTILYAFPTRIRKQHPPKLKSLKPVQFRNLKQKKQKKILREKKEKEFLCILLSSPKVQRPICYKMNKEPSKGWQQDWTLIWERSMGMVYPPTFFTRINQSDKKKNKFTSFTNEIGYLLACRKVLLPKTEKHPGPRTPRITTRANCPNLRPAQRI